MKWQDMSIRRKFLFAFGVILSFIFLISVVGIVTIKITEDNIERWNNIKENLLVLMNIENAHMDWRHALRNAVDDGSMKKLQEIEVDHKKCVFGKWYYSKDRDNLLAEFPEISGYLIEIEGIHKGIHDDAAAIRDILSEGNKGANSEASKILKSGVLPATKKFRDTLQRMREQAHKKLNNIEELVKRDLTISKAVDAVVMLTFIIVVALMFTRLTNHITQNIDMAVKAAERLAEGEITVEIKADHQDETGALLKAVQRTAHSLSSMSKAAERIAEGDLTVDIKPKSDRDMIGRSLNIMTSNLKRQIQDILEAVNVLASSINQIMTSATEIAASASQTATSVSETTVTAEEVRQNAKMVSTKANNVSDVTRKVVEASQSVYASVDDTIEKMNSIRTQMESIAESIVKLSEQGQAIGEIINTVSDLAEQSNLLAVNASIEAARAGEQGRGFSVVAQEVRSLAEQSKSATVQIRNILSDIQNATSKAVLVTEQGSKAVAEGLRQSSDTGLSIRDLARRVSEVSDAGAQIVASSQQQSAGMEQIVFAMDNINQASTQNADNIRMVETVARNLNDIAQKLKAMTDKYRV